MTKSTSETWRTTVVLDSNVFVAAGFRPECHAGRIIDAVRAGHLRLVWSEATRRESAHVVRKIPRLRWERFEDLFRNADRVPDALDPDRFDYVPDPEDRKFAALAHAAGAALITQDDDLLAHRSKADVPILTAREFLRYVLGPPDAAG